MFSLKKSTLTLAGFSLVTGALWAYQEPLDAVVVHRAAADEAWRLRAQEVVSSELNHRGIEELEQLLVLEPNDVEAHWKLARAIYFLGEYGTTDDAVRLELFTRGRNVTEDALDRIATTLGGRDKLDKLSLDELAKQFRDQPAVARVYFWGAIQWGLWGRQTGPFSAARQGVANRIRNYSAAVIALDPGYEAGGGHRMLGRLHAEAPKVPFFTGWIDRDRAVSELRLALDVAPDDFFNRLFYAEALIDYRSEQLDEGIDRLKALLGCAPEGENQVEEAHVLKLAHRRMESLPE